MNDSYFKEPYASIAEEKRQKARERGRIPFDCYNAIYPARDNRVKCKLGHKMGVSKNGTMELATVMAGRLSAGCRHCKDFNGD